MFVQNELQKKNFLSPNKYPQNNLQWKKASKNLQNFIQNEQLSPYPTYRISQQKRTTSSKKDKLSTMQSMGNIHYSNKQTERQSYEFGINKEKYQNEKLIIRQKSFRSPQKLSISPKLQITDKQQIIAKSYKIYAQIGIQAFQEEVLIKKRNLIEENICLKQLVQILQKQILSYSKTISQNQTKITKLNLQINSLQNNLSLLNKKVDESKQKYEKQVELNKCMQYIIAELNDKVKILIKKNTQLQQIIQEYKYKEQRNLAETFSQSQSSQSSLSINSETYKKNEYNELFKNSDSIIQVFQSNLDDKENWSFSALDMSCFSKTPNKIHEVQINQQSQRHPNSTSQFCYDQQVDDIILKHKTEINKLKQKIKYFQIQNQMLRRKKQISQKNTSQIQELKLRIEKLSEQNKIIKLIQGKKKNTLKQTKQQPIVKKFQLESTKLVKNAFEKQNDPKQNDIQKQNNKKQSQNVEVRQNQKSLQSQQKINSKRKSPLQRKFVRKQGKSSPRSSSSIDQDSQISLEFSPDKI